jgi:hypothetical protein
VREIMETGNIFQNECDYLSHHPNTKVYMHKESGNIILHAPLPGGPYIGEREHFITENAFISWITLDDMSQDRKFELIGEL